MMSTARRILSTAFLFMVVPLAAGIDVFRMYFRYGFGDGQIGDPSAQPTEQDVKGLMCKTNQFFTESLRNYTKNSAVEFYATEITYGFDDWIYEGTEPEAPRNVPVIVNFTAKVITTDGSTPPSNQELWEGTKYFEYFSYIMKYIWEIEGQNFFKDTRGLWYEPFIQAPVTGQIQDNDQCPSPAANRGDDFVLVTTLPSLMPINTPNPTNPPNTFAPTTLTPTTLAPTTTPPPISRVVTLAPSKVATQPPISRAVTLAPTNAADEMVYFTIQIDFFVGKEQEPTEAEIKAMMCQAQKFFQVTLNQNLGPDVTVTLTNIDYEWDDKKALPSIVEFFANAVQPDGSHTEAQKVFDSMEKVDVKQMVQDYIWQAEPYKENEFYQTEDIFFAGSYSGSENPPEPHAGKFDKLDCPP